MNERLMFRRKVRQNLKVICEAFRPILNGKFAHRSKIQQVFNSLRLLPWETWGPSEFFIQGENKTLLRNIADLKRWVARVPTLRNDENVQEMIRQLDESAK